MLALTTSSIFGLDELWHVTIRSGQAPFRALYKYEVTV